MGIKCNICKGRVEKDNIYCLQCAFAKGICESCGKRISDVKMYKQSDIDYRKLKRIKEDDRNKEKALNKKNLDLNKLNKESLNLKRNIEV
jgi:hypothetical protein